MVQDHDHKITGRNPYRNLCSRSQPFLPPRGLKDYTRSTSFRHRVLASFCLVCSSWLIPARALLFRNIYLEDFKLLCRLSEALTWNFGLHDFVRLIEVEVPHNSREWVVFETVLEKLTELKSIHLNLRRPYDEIDLRHCLAFIRAILPSVELVIYSRMDQFVIELFKQIAKNTDVSLPCFSKLTFNDKTNVTTGTSRSAATLAFSYYQMSDHELRALVEYCRPSLEVFSLEIRHHNSYFVTSRNLIEILHGPAIRSIRLFTYQTYTLESIRVYPMDEILLNCPSIQQVELRGNWLSAEAFKGKHESLEVLSLSAFSTISQLDVELLLENL
ncbi:hypothetical protein BT69DRAFT_485863 [Atractiella rhizophila]|nr:hypothetical protein BT69DRAFT_485863 [Atractiella rhizophila]